MGRPIAIEYGRPNAFARELELVGLCVLHISESSAGVWAYMSVRFVA